MNTLSATALAIPLFTGIWWLAGLAVRPLHQRLRGRMHAMKASGHERALLMIGSLPLLLAAGITLLLFVPAASESWISAHCHDGIGCNAHAPAVQAPGAVLMLYTLSTLLLLAGALRIGRLLHRHNARRRQLQQLAEADPKGDFDVVDCELPFAVTAGLWQCRSFISSGLLAQLDTHHRDSVRAHEAMHRQRRDNLRLALAEVLTPGTLAAGRSGLLAELRQTSEQCCDAAAAQQLGDPLAVAEALIHVRRITAASTAAPKPSVTRSSGSVLAQRVQVLLAAPSMAPGLHPVAMAGLAAAALGIALFGANAVHHGTEILLALLQPG